MMDQVFCDFCVVGCFIARFISFFLLPLILKEGEKMKQKQEIARARNSKKEKESLGGKTQNKTNEWDPIAHG